MNKYCYRQAEIGVGDCAGLRVQPTGSGSRGAEVMAVFCIMLPGLMHMLLPAELP